MYFEISDGNEDKSLSVKIMLADRKTTIDDNFILYTITNEKDIEYIIVNNKNDNITSIKTNKLVGFDHHILKLAFEKYKGQVYATYYDIDLTDDRGVIYNISKGNNHVTKYKIHKLRNRLLRKFFYDFESTWLFVILAVGAIIAIISILGLFYLLDYL